MFAHKRFVHAEHPLGFFSRLCFRFVDSVAFLPQKFGCPQEQSRPHFPSHDVAPLVDQDRQITIRLHPFRVACADDRLTRRPNDQRFGQFRFRIGHQPTILVDLEPVMCDHGTLFGKAFDVLSFLREITQWNE